MRIKSSYIGCVVVTYNRLNKLKVALEAYEKQNVVPQYVMVINNHSTDGTEEFLKEWKRKDCGFDKIVYNLQKNGGGSGGFYEGFKQALNKSAEWIWVADDDAYPEEHAIEVLDNWLITASENVSAVCTSVVEEGKYGVGHRKNIRQEGLQLIKEPILEDEYTNREFKLMLFSYVGTAVSKKALEKAGLTEAGYFIHNDDSEHSLRILKTGEIYCIPEAKVVHAVEKNENLDGRPDWRYYYDVRNSYDMERRHFPSVYYWHIIRDGLISGLHIIFGIKSKKHRLLLEALTDAVFRNMGMHSVYKPGWKADFKV